ncbi:hypothetical protein PanNE5_18490 [Pandoraea sp. NE5]|uniref:restriction endonuclease subunit S n=1 Tax=Pandoraea sp. NE5 TaxID=2904129 RepID=UPI0021C28DB4|nr:restriction endonuclease subunit S [Pandoraea sp. NE5]BDD92409.1 hypothetical protein PanNE5_18490 [Pandoraea sp. NE5]
MMTAKHSTELPSGWRLTVLSEIAVINPTIDKSSIPDTLEVSFVPMPAVQAGTGGIDVSQTRLFGAVRKGYTPFQEGDVLFAKITPCMENGKMAVVPQLKGGLGFGSTEFHVLRPHQGIDKNYLYYYVSSESFRREAQHNMSGAVGQRRVTTPYLTACKLPLPPEHEQRRIVAKIEELLSELDNGIEGLKTAQDQLKVYRQALLKHAFDGKLTAQWRADNPDKLETADALLKRIQLERAQRYQQRLTDWEASDKQGGKPRTPKALPRLTAEELGKLPDLPTGWSWVRLGDVATIIAGHAFEKSEYSDSGVRLFQIANVSFGEVSWDKEVLLPNEYWETFEELRLFPDDIVMALNRPLIGDDLKICKLRTTDSPSILYQRVGKFVPHEPNIRNLIYWYLRSPIFISSLKAELRGVNIPFINQSRLMEYAIPLFSFSELSYLVDELERVFSEAIHLDQIITTALQQAEALRQSILKKAFSGQLVPQDPNDEPASALLAHIRAEKFADSQDKKARK